MNENSETQAYETEALEVNSSALAMEIPDQDDRYPGSFFRIPGVPVPGKTTWSLS
jgi:hypothetical protein